MKKNLMKLFIVVAAFFICTTANAMTGLEFMRYTLFEQADILKPIIISYVSQGYKQVPNWPTLASEIDVQIRRWGLGDKNIEDIALEAAKVKGMTMW